MISKKIRSIIREAFFLIISGMEVFGLLFSVDCGFVLFVRGYGLRVYSYFTHHSLLIFFPAKKQPWSSSLRRTLVRHTYVDL